jgi:hypothetical protein
MLTGIPAGKGVGSVTEDSSPALWLRQARSYLRNADPVLARLIDDRPARLHCWQRIGKAASSQQAERRHSSGGAGPLIEPLGRRIAPSVVEAGCRTWFVTPTPGSAPTSSGLCPSWAVEKLMALDPAPRLSDRQDPEQSRGSLSADRRTTGPAPWSPHRARRRPWRGRRSRCACCPAVGPAVGEAVLCSHGELIGAVLERLVGHDLDDEVELAWPKGSTWVLDVDDGHLRRRHYLPPLRLHDTEAGYF